MADKEITIYDIAQEAGVSPATVSRVLTNSAKVSAAKKETVEKIIQKYGFRPNAMARSLSETQTKVLGIIVADIRNPYYATLVVECEIAANKLGYSVMVCNALSDFEHEKFNLAKLYEQRVDAIIQLGCSVDDMISNREYAKLVGRVARTIPFVITGKLDGANCYHLHIDDLLAMELIFQHLLDNGHSKIALVGGMQHVKSTNDKTRHYIYLAGKNGLELRNEYMLDGDFSDIGGRKCARQLMALSDPPTAIITVNDYTAVGVLQELTLRGIKVPEDISIVSFDNTYLCNIVTPQLTSIDYDYPLFGRKLVEIAQQAIQKQEVERFQTIRPNLQIRSSSGAAK